MIFFIKHLNNLFYISSSSDSKMSMYTNEKIYINMTVTEYNNKIQIIIGNKC